MKLSELMATHTPSPTFEGFVTNDDLSSRSIAPQTAPPRLRTTRSRSLA